MNIYPFLCQNEKPCEITVYANHVVNNVGLAAGAVLSPSNICKRIRVFYKISMAK